MDNGPMETPALIDNAAQSRFERQENGHLAFANYRLSAGVLSLPYVEAAPALRGTGAAGRLMQDVAEHARRSNLKIVPICGYAVSWFRRHPEYKDTLEIA